MLKYILISFLIITNAYAYTCEEMGYTKTIADCPDGGLKCPAQPEKMFCCDPCGNRGGYKYTLENCSPEDGLQIAGTECGGKWTECRQCTSEYKYNKDNCRAPKILAGVQCGNAYTQCVYPSGIGCIPTVGYIYYSDGSCHADYDNTKTPVGIIVDASRRRIMELYDQQNLKWSAAATLDEFIDISDLHNMSQENALLDFEGQSNTDRIIAFVASNGQEHFAAQHCANKKTGNIKWYLPALGELYTLYANLTPVQEGLATVPSTVSLSVSSARYFSSTEYSKETAWTFRFSDGVANDYWGHKYWANNVRCFSKF